MRERQAVILLVLIILLSAVDSLAQDRDKKLGIGGLVGRTNGITMKLYLSSTIQAGRFTDLTAVDINASWNLGDFFFWNGHLLRERAIPDSPLHYFIGPGFAFGYDSGRLFWGPSAVLGVYFDRERFEVFMHVAPRLLILPDVHGELGSSVGLRYYL